jgi:hypothetical protein
MPSNWTKADGNVKESRLTPLRVRIGERRAAFQRRESRQSGPVERNDIRNMTGDGAKHAVV